MARALIVGCGCRGTDLGGALIGGGWRVRGTSRDRAGAERIEAAGIEAAIADPERAMTILDQVEGVALIFWLMGSARGTPEQLEAIHGPRLERLMEEIVDTPVRGIVYEAAGTVSGAWLGRGAEIVRVAGERWRIPSRSVSTDPGRPDAWREAMLAAAEELLET